MLLIVLFHQKKKKKIEKNLKTYHLYTYMCITLILILYIFIESNNELIIDF